jgi:hypothetical protein
VIGCSKTTNAWASSGLRHGLRRIDNRTDDEEHDKSGNSFEKGMEREERILQENR